MDIVKIIDAHIHLDHYNMEDIEHILYKDDALDALIAVSYDLDSCKQNLLLAQKHPKLKPAFGWHPEQELIPDHEFAELIDWMTRHQQEMIAVGEVGLPYYLHKEHSFPMEGYIERLETFLSFAKSMQKPIVLHAVYEDAPLVCDLLEKHSIHKAHFHWFKGDQKTIKRMAQNGYFISVTPDVCYEKEIAELVHSYPLEQMMVETDGPWPFDGPFKGMLTHPSMIHRSIQMIADIKKMPINMVYKQLYKNTKTFYEI